MTTTHDRLRADVAAWWAAHPDFREKYARMRHTNADSLARSTVHWHHNVEAARRYGSGSGGDFESSTYFLREYAKLATIAWLLEAQDEIDALASSDADKWWKQRDLESVVYSMQHALDAFEHNEPVVREERVARAKAKEGACTK